MPDALTGSSAWLPDVLAVQAIASGAMCGVIWFVQLVHYPLLGRLNDTDARRATCENLRRTPWVVVPFMLAEGVTAMAVAVCPPAGVGRPVAVAGVAVVAALWASTVLVQMPLHARLAAGDDMPRTTAALVRGNWLRTALWTARALLAGWMLTAAC